MNNRNFESFENFIGNPIPEVLYHYTNLNGLIGILNNKEIWFSDLYFLNDKNEFELGLNLVTESFEKLKKINLEKPLLKIFFDELTTAINLIKDEGQAFVLSLTSDSDLLSQWRGYTENGVGVNLGIKTSFFKDSKIRIFKCIYDPIIQKEFADAIVHKAIDTFEERYETLSKTSEYGDEELLIEAISIAGGYFIDNTILACSLIKHFGFIEEQEWRAIFLNQYETVHFLAKQNFYKPFVKIELKDFDEYLSSITAGPNPERELCHLSIRKLLQSKSISKTYIDFSIIPYRN